MSDSLFVRATNISDAWAQTFLGLLRSRGGEAHPAVVQIDLNGAVEDMRIRSCLDMTLKQLKKSSCETVAGTIFPISMWNPNAEDNAEPLFARYERAWPGIRKCPANRNGVYFRRLTAAVGEGPKGAAINQLRQIAHTFASGNHRRSALQASIFDPRFDHSNSRQRGFPCLQQVAFTPIGGGDMSVTGYYATQYQVEKAYGNYLGLFRLGLFMGVQLNLRVTRVVCIANLLSLGSIGKTQLTGLERKVAPLMGQASKTVA